MELYYSTVYYSLLPPEALFNGMPRYVHVGWKEDCPGRCREREMESSTSDNIFIRIQPIILHTL